MDIKNEGRTFWDFAKDHPWMTFFLLDSVICVTGNVIISLINMARGEKNQDIV